MSVDTSRLSSVWVGVRVTNQRPASGLVLIACMAKHSGPVRRLLDATWHDAEAGADIMRHHERWDGKRIPQWPFGAAQPSGSANHLGRGRVRRDDLRQAPPSRALV
jgi:hypothetical protein